MLDGVFFRMRLIVPFLLPLLLVLLLLFLLLVVVNQRGYGATYVDYGA